MAAQAAVADGVDALFTPQDNTVMTAELSIYEMLAEAGPLSSPGDHPNPGIKPRSPTLQTDSLPAEPQGKLKNTGVGSLSLLHQTFPTQERVSCIAGGFFTK